MNVLIIGASGLLGGNCLKVFGNDNKYNVTGTYFSFSVDGVRYYNTLDANDTENFDIDNFKPELIIHTGALTHVDLCEKEPEKSYEQTVISTKNMINLANFHKAQLVFISTDYVFDGSYGPYPETAQTNPVNIYGKHKLEAEKMVLDEMDNALIIRITNVYGDEVRGKNFVARIMKTAMEKQALELKLPVDQYATPTNAYDIAKAILELNRLNKKGIYHIASTDYMNRVQLAQKVLSYFPQHNINVIPVSTEELNQTAERPLQSGLKSKKFLDEFKTFEFSNLDNYLQKSLNKIAGKII